MEAVIIDSLLKVKDNMKNILEKFAIFLALKIIENMKGTRQYPKFANYFNRTIKEMNFPSETREKVFRKTEPILLGDFNEKNPKVFDGEECKNDDDCLSGMCEREICISQEEKMDTE